MKLLVTFLVSGAFALTPTFGHAQNNFDSLAGQINRLQRQSQDMQFEVETKLQDQQRGIQDLAKRQDTLGKSLENARFDIDFLKSMRGFEDSSRKMDTLESKLSDTEERLRKAEKIIADLDIRLMTLEAQSSKPKTSPSKTTAAPKKTTSAAKEGTR